MLVASALAFLFLELVCSEVYDYEYAEGYGDDHYHSYGEMPAAFGHGSHTGRFRRFGEATVGPNLTSTGVGPNRTSTGVGPNRTSIGVGFNRTSNGAGPNRTSTGVGLNRTYTGDNDELNRAFKQIQSGRQIFSTDLNDITDTESNEDITGLTPNPLYTKDITEFSEVVPAEGAVSVPSRTSMVPWTTQVLQGLTSSILNQQGRTFRTHFLRRPKVDDSTSSKIHFEPLLRNNVLAENKGAGREGSDEENTQDPNATTELSKESTTTSITEPTRTLATELTITTTTTRPTTQFDIEKFLDIVANLTYDYETNLTRQINETLHMMSIPTCPTGTTETIPTTEEDEYHEINKTIMAKCFVCGLKTPGIPYDADCADAFAGDFLPLVPQDPRAKGKIARFRKYCRFGDYHNYYENVTQPRTLYGRWTGGCSVRWTDLSGIYTQRACRNRKRAVTGKHYASKRMAKLEMTLANTDNGCMVSPVATLLPLSRGVSLFARFHACVCTGNWCNAAEQGLASLVAVAAAVVTVYFAMLLGP